MLSKLFGGRKVSSDPILIVGGGIGGMASAIMLSRSGFNVELIDLDPNWRVYGAGITITGPTLRAYKRLDMVDDLARHGAIYSGGKILTYQGEFLQQLDEPILEDGLPATGGIMRPVLHELMQKRIRAANIPVSLGVTVEGLQQDEDGVFVRLSNGVSKRYGVVVGADGIGSVVRKMVFDGGKEPVATGQGCWRVSIERPEGLETGEIYLGHEYPAGLNCCSPNEMYLWLLTPDDGSLWVDDDEALDLLRERLRDFGGNVAWVRENVNASHWVNYRPLEAVLQPGPWSNGRVVLVGDSAHATTPHLASGAGMAVEGAIVLADELSNPDRAMEDSLLAYSRRRFERCRHVVDASIEVGRLQLEGAPAEKVGAKMGAALHKLAEPF